MNELETVTKSKECTIDSHPIESRKLLDKNKISKEIARLRYEDVVKCNLLSQAFDIPENMCIKHDMTLKITVKIIRIIFLSFLLTLM